MICAPTGMGKTTIAEAAVYEALLTGKRIYYTTPLIALTDQKFREMQDLAQKWGFPREQVGLITGNRRVNPDAQVLVVVAEILLNRLLNQAAFDFGGVFAVVMDEFHSFSDPERGIVWEFALALLPRHARLLLLSSTVGNALPFLGWLRSSHERDLDLVQGTERRVPLEFAWVPDLLLNELLEEMAAAGGDVIGIDWRVDLGRAWDRIGPGRGIMGNLDPTALLAPGEVLDAGIRAVLAAAAGRPGHVFNLGHGILPDTPVAHAKALVEMVHELSAR